MMTADNIYGDIATRTGGDIYIGVVGPVRTGKSTVIKKIMETLVLPNITNDYDRERAKDELPQSSGGKTVMTTEPKFIPDEAVTVKIDDSSNISIKLIDCVGYIVPDALGQIENGKPRMVHTPWSKEAMPFAEAAEYGTKKVITDHSTIGLLVTTDGTVCDLDRKAYIDAEERVASELRKIGKPFAIILNSANPASESALSLASELEEKYSSPVALVNALTLNKDDITGILSLILGEFPLTELSLTMPDWTSALDSDSPILSGIREDILNACGKIHKTGECRKAIDLISENPAIDKITDLKIDMGSGKVKADLSVCSALYYKTLSEMTGEKIENDKELINLLKVLSEKAKKYEKLEAALDAVETKGYGIVMPSKESLRLEEPKIVKQPGGFGVRLKASAPSIHMIKADIETEINPVVGSEQQSEELVRYLLDSFEGDPAKLWETNMFGRSLFDLVRDGLESKLQNMPDESRERLCETLGRIVNEGSNGLICILL